MYMELYTSYKSHYMKENRSTFVRDTKKRLVQPEHDQLHHALPDGGGGAITWCHAGPI